MAAVKRKMLNRTVKRIAKFNNRALQIHVHSIAGSLNELQRVDTFSTFKLATKILSQNAENLSQLIKDNQNCFINRDNLRGN